MFENKKRKNEESLVHSNYNNFDNDSKMLNKKNIIIFIVSFVVIFILIIFFVKINNNNNNNKIKNNPEKYDKIDKKSTTTILTLPEDINNKEDCEYDIGTSTENIKAEDLTFGHFYEKQKNEFISSLDSYELPINVKTDVINYYDISRKISIDKYVQDFNNYGFSIIKNNLGENTNNFFNAYRAIIKKDIPLIITNDFIFYIYQNELKQIFKEIEKNAFYDTVWNINKELYNIALVRYKKYKLEVGIANDPILEALRLEVSYFAVSLSLLTPEYQQINHKANFIDDSKFNEQEVDVYYFKMPDDIKIQVDKEIELIKESSKKNKSPIFLYQKDYNEFKVPLNYKKSAKLNNFYLTIKWLNSVFPLYYKNEECENCLLDYDDWAINLAGANFIAKDLYSNQKLKNQWAILYKFISFFSGLRADLTYLHYNRTMQELFGDDYNIEEIFSFNNQNRNNDLIIIQKKLADIKFLEIEGTMNRESKKIQPILGMRMLQEAYWPNSYILNSLIGNEMIATKKSNKIITQCSIKGKDNFRCAGSGMDIINILDKVNIKDNTFIKNTSYKYYGEKVENLRKKINDFDIFTWNNNIYWSTLDIGKTLLNYDNSKYPVFIKEDTWKIKRDYNTFLGAWVNLHLSADQLVNYSEKSGGNLGIYKNCNMNNYIEPNIDLLNKMIAKNIMLVKILSALKVDKQTNIVSIKLKELNKKIKKIIEIEKKELLGEDINIDDCRFINDLASHYIVDNNAEKSFKINFNKKVLTESIDGIKLLSIIYSKNNKKIMAIGPIFNYKEY